MSRTPLAALLFIGILHLTSSDSIDNGVAGEPTVECATDGLTVNFNTEKEFEGHVYVKGHYEDPACRVDATLQNRVNMSIPFTSCDVRRQRSSNPKGLYVSVTMIITFHPMFITKIDKSYNVQCFYTELDKTVNTQLDVSLARNQEKKIVVVIGGEKDELQAPSQRKHADNNTALDDYNALQTEVINQAIPLPTCKYHVLKDGPDGEPVKFATVGQQVYHQWSCASEGVPAAENVYCATIHSCNVRDETGKEVQLLDENGCSVDKYLLNNLIYTTDLTGGQISQVFKFADQPSLFFQCQIRLTLKEDGKCLRTSDTCPQSARGKRSVDAASSKSSDHEVDVFSQSMTVFEIDQPINSKSVRALDDPVTAFSHNAMCVSPSTFGVLIALLASVFLLSTVTTALLCCRSQTVKLNFANSRSMTLAFPHGSYASSKRNSPHRII
ncbi:hypothetical protein QR680_001967 [Steinernema hermaphroditum]|uniref:ZP domain-containing protein n=1 Tax=Steinernema hermaphroditum TaxID=289476 RepID=A0AA39H0P2_9BILA|nr:hypothetical protein QR680_001967 [Steinernema hermaphroditum]